ncbi:MAG: hypothetical protein IPK99_15850 [Flavobacteriales bacterium]|nr:hypothetical protein [Flavobacteriales bacterium]
MNASFQLNEDDQVLWELVDMAGRTARGGVAVLSAGVVNMAIEVAGLEAGTYLVRLIPQRQQAMLQQMVSVR